MQTTPYLYFKGECEAALQFYAACGLGEMSQVMRFGGSPAAAMAGPAWAEKIMHCRFDGPALRLCASDTPDAEPMKGVALLLEPDDVAAGAALFEKLSEGGRVTAPFAKQFWGDHYGNFTDRFGVQWAMNCAAPA
jgi:PhnB protein